MFFFFYKVFIFVLVNSYFWITLSLPSLVLSFIGANLEQNLQWGSPTLLLRYERRDPFPFFTDCSQCSKRPFLSMGLDLEYLPAVCKLWKCFSLHPPQLFSAQPVDIYMHIQLSIHFSGSFSRSFLFSSILPSKFLLPWPYSAAVLPF